MLVQFKTENKAVKWLEKLRWNGAPVCPHCGGTDNIQTYGGKKYTYRHKDCRKAFTVKTGTIMHSSKLEARQWVSAVYKVLTVPEGVSPQQLSKELGITQKSAWYMLQRISQGCEKGPFELSGESDGDKATNGHVAGSAVRGKRRRKGKLKALEICAGAGGTALGLESAGFDHVALVEFEKHACATLRKNRPYWNVIQADIKYLDFTVGDWQGIDLVSGGLPCPPFSLAGKQLGPEDDRDLFPTMLKIVKATRPRAVLVENVRGLLSRRFDKYRDNIGRQLKRLGFSVHWNLLNAAEYGVPQNRWRSFMVALRDGETGQLEWPEPFTTPPKTVGRVLLDLMASRGWAMAEKWAAGADKVSPTIVGGSWKHGGPDLGPTRARAEWLAMGVDGKGLADEPPTAGFKGNPRLTVEMIKRLQSFPDEWQLMGSKTAAHRQVGNALPAGLACAVAQSVHRCLA